MNDLISRQDALSAVGASMIGQLAIKGDTEEWREVLKSANEMILELPSAQPEVIRCKDCKYWDTTWESDYAPNYHFCPMLGRMREGDFYCADAERRTDG